MVRGWIFRIFLLLAVVATVSVVAKSPSEAVKASVAPYLMPENHPIKPLLDSLFSSSRAIFHVDSLIKAGFKKAKPRKFTKLLVTSHPNFPGYIFKLYLDAQRFHKDQPEYDCWVLRCQGVEKIRQAIADYNLDAYFKTPKKWIYELPKKPAPPEGYYTKYYILVEEDMDIFCNQENKDLWASAHVTKELLNGLFLIVNDVGLRDIKPDNLPFCRDGKVAFIDTQTWNKKVPFERFCQFLSPANERYWETIIP